jgi:hypothetical protein
MQFCSQIRILGLVFPNPQPIKALSSLNEPTSTLSFMVWWVPFGLSLPSRLQGLNLYTRPLHLGYMSHHQYLIISPTRPAQSYPRDR